ncbi:F-box/FBD/LRR-repeat protein, partial [Mucuna pruriens]
MDRLSELPDFVLLHIMKFMSMKHAVQTCVLSTRWKKLWKHLTNLAFNSSDFVNLVHFSKFVSWVMSNRDNSVSLHSLDLRRKGCIDHEFLDRIMGYAVSHDVQQLTVEVNLNVKLGFKLHPGIFSCESLTFLKLSIWAVPSMTELPSSLSLPALKSLHLEHVTFTVNDSDCAEPFSNCHMLNTLVLDHCNLHNAAKFLCICNSNLSTLTIGSTIQEVPYKFVLSTPNLRSLAVMRDPIHQLSACNLSFLEQVNIDVEAYFHTHFERTHASLISLLQVLADYVKIMILSSSTLKILYDLSTSGSMITQIPCFVQLKSLKLKMKSSSNISDEVVSRTVEYLLQKSPVAKVDKETKGKLMMKSERQRTSGRGRGNAKDRLSELPDGVLIHIMEFIDITYAVRTCVLSKRWKNLWRCLSILSFSCQPFRKISAYNKFVSQVLSGRDRSFSLINLRFEAYDMTAPKLMNKVMQHVAMNSVPSFYHQISSTCNLSFLEEVNIDTCSSIGYPVIISWLEFLTNVKILTLSMHVFEQILNDLSNLSTMPIQPPRFVRLESLKVKWNRTFPKLSMEELNITVNYLLQNSQLTKVDVTDCFDISLEERKEGKLIMKKKRQKKRSRRDREEEKDRLSELPECVLIHIMEFMDTKYAVQTCVLSKRWKDLWKRLTNLEFNTFHFNNVANFSKFVSRVLSGRDGSISLLNLEFTRRGCAEPKLLNRLMKYAVLHNVQHFTVFINLNFRPSFEFRPYIFSCRSLTFLKLSISSYDPSMIILPECLRMPLLKSLQLDCVTFTASDNDYAEPFSTCNMLNTLILQGCSLHKDAKFLCISNSNLSSLTIVGSFEAGAYRIALSTPNLSSLSVMGHNNHPFSSACNLSFLEEVTIDTVGLTCFQKTDLLIISWLQVLTNVKIMTLSLRALGTILQDLSNPVSMSTVPPCFVQLKSLKVKKESFVDISDEQVNRAAEYLLQNSPLARIDSGSSLKKKTTEEKRPHNRLKNLKIMEELCSFYFNLKPLVMVLFGLSHASNVNLESEFDLLIVYMLVDEMLKSLFSLFLYSVQEFGAVWAFCSQVNTPFLVSFFRFFIPWSSSVNYALIF